MFVALVAEHARLMALLAEQRSRCLSRRVFSIEGGQHQHLRIVMASRAAIARSKELLAKPVYTAPMSTIEITSGAAKPLTVAPHFRPQAKIFVLHSTAAASLTTSGQVLPIVLRMHSR